MRTSAVIALLTLLPLTAGAEEIQGTISKTGAVVSIKVGTKTTALSGELAAELALLDGEPVTLEARRAGKDLVVDRIVSPERTDVQAVGRLKAKKQVLVTRDGKTLTPIGRTGLISTTMERTYDVWKFPAAADGTVRVSVVAYEAETTKSWIILSSKPKMSVPSGYIRGRGRSAWIEQESGDWVRIRYGDSVGWIPAGYAAAIEQKPKKGLITVLDAAGE